MSEGGDKRFEQLADKVIRDLEIDGIFEYNKRNAYELRCLQFIVRK